MSVQIIGWALIHSLWQGALITGCVTLVLALMRRSSARGRYNVCLAALLLTVTAPVVTAVVMDMPGVVLEQRRGDLSSDREAFVSDVNTAADQRSITVANTSPTPSPTASPSTLDSAGLTAITEALRIRLDRMMPWLVALWITGVALLSLRLAGGIRYTKRLLDDGGRPGNANLETIVRRLAMRMGIRRVVRVLESARGQVPLVVGWLRPVIVVPTATLLGLPASQLELILVHELAHIRRYDFVVNVLQTVIETLVFYHPAVWWLSARIREEREHCCDDIVIETLGTDGVTYARALLAVEEGRAAAVGLAAAATGGSLLGRIRRLVEAEPSRLELGSRWAAGVLGMAAVALGANAMIGNAASPANPSGAAESSLQSAALKPKPTSQQFSSDSTRARPSRVLRYDGSGELVNGWRWAEEQARALDLDEAWVGYVVQGDENGRFWLHMDHRTPVRFDGGVTMGTLLIDRTDNVRGLNVAGTPLSAVVGEHAPYDLAIFFGVTRSGGRLRVTRVHVSNVVFPVYFDRMPLLWLGEADDEESLDLVRRLDLAPTKNLAEDMITVIGAHRSSNLVVPVLVAILEDRGAPQDVRADAAKWLGRHPSARSLSTLVRAARGEGPEDVRRESIEALAHLDVAGASDSVIALARSLGDSELRSEAIESLGHREEPRAFGALVEIARSARETDDQRKAVESIAESVDPRRNQVLEELARRDGNAEVRKEAVENLSHAKQGTELIEALESIALNDRDREVQEKAIEALAEMEDSRATSALVSLVDRASSADVRRQAVEALGNSHSHEQSITALDRLVWRHPDGDVQASAAEALGSFEDTRVVGMLADIAIRHPSGDVQRRAVEALGEAHPHEAAIEALRRIVFEHSHAKVQLVAVESLGNFEEQRALNVLIDVARRHPNAEVRKAAIEAME